VEFATPLTVARAELIGHVEVGRGAREHRVSATEKSGACAHGHKVGRDNQESFRSRNFDSRSGWSTRRAARGEELGKSLFLPFQWHGEMFSGARTRLKSNFGVRPRKFSIIATKSAYLNLDSKTLTERSNLTKTNKQFISPGPVAKTTNEGRGRSSHETLGSPVTPKIMASCPLLRRRRAARPPRRRFCRVAGAAKEKSDVIDVRRARRHAANKLPT
jgi:hypothetical protein